MGSGNAGWHGGGSYSPSAAAATTTHHTVLSVQSSDEFGRGGYAQQHHQDPHLTRRNPSSPNTLDPLRHGSPTRVHHHHHHHHHHQQQQQQHPPPLAHGLVPGRSRARSRSDSPPRTRSGSGAARSGGGGGHGRGGRHGSTTHNLVPGIAALEAPGRSRLAWLLPMAIDKEIALAALAVAGASMGDPLMSLVDTAMVGRLGTAPLAALGSNGALFNCIFFLFFTALAVITTQSLAAANARGDKAGVGRGLVQALAAMVVVSVGLTALLTAAPEAILGLFATNAEMMEDAKTYLVIRALCLPAALFMCVCQAAFRSLLDLRTPLIVVCVSNAANYIFDEVFMFRLGGGMAGCGWASVVSQYLGAVLFAALLNRRRSDFGLTEALDSAAEAALGGGGSGGSFGGSRGGVRLGKRISVDLELNAGEHGGLHHRDSGSGSFRSSERDPLLGDGGGGGADGVHSPLRPRLQRGGGGGAGAAGSGSFGSFARGGKGGAVAAAVAAMPLRRKVSLLLVSLPWRPFLQRFAGLSVRGCLILSTYTSASVVAARAGTAVIAAHQVVQQHQQLQMSIAWAFLHVAQAMVSNVFHSPAGPRAARLLATRIVLIAAAYCSFAALATASAASSLPRVFTSDGAVLALVRAAELPACLMMAIAWNNCLEGCLLAVDEAPFVVRTYPFAAAAALAQLARTGLSHAHGGAAIRGVWWGLMIYYLVLLVAFAGRCSWRASKPLLAGSSS